MQVSVTTGLKAVLAKLSIIFVEGDFGVSLRFGVLTDYPQTNAALQEAGTDAANPNRFSELVDE